VADFGFSRNFTQNDLSETYCGSTAYTAPEVLTATGSGLQLGWSVVIFDYQILIISKIEIYFNCKSYWLKIIMLFKKLKISVKNDF